ncbi:MAG: hypothetical protein ISS23_00235 [Nanoarchaeota archaeon]|nr:hypothetical protein [Nanoarchaeota archaeon]
MVDKKLLNSIKQYIDQGVGISSIKQGLTRAGWSEKDINNAVSQVTGQKAVKQEAKPSADKSSIDKKRIIFIAGGAIVILSIAFLAYFFLFKVGFSEDIPADLVPGKLNSFIKERIEGYNSLALVAKSPLSEAIQNGKVNLIMTDNIGKKVIDAMGIVVEDNQVVSTSLKVDDPSFDVKFTEKIFDNTIASNDPNSVFFKGYSKGKIKIKAYNEENEAKLELLNDFVPYFFVL